MLIGVAKVAEYTTCSIIDVIDFKMPSIHTCKIKKIKLLINNQRERSKNGRKIPYEMKRRRKKKMTEFFKGIEMIFAVYYDIRANMISFLTK